MWLIQVTHREWAGPCLQIKAAVQKETHALQPLLFGLTNAVSVLLVVVRGGPDLYQLYPCALYQLYKVISHLSSLISHNIKVKDRERSDPRYHWGTAADWGRAAARTPDPLHTSP